MGIRTEGVGLYFHIPFCKKKCNYCDFNSYSGLEFLWEEYIGALCSEIDLKSNDFINREIKTIFIGGGTPSLIPYVQINRLLEHLSRFTISENAEITLEANPGTLNEEKIKAYYNAGINRLSLGLQSYQEELLKYLGRLHTPEQFDEAVYLAQKNGFANINADIIIGIPNQSLKDHKKTLERVMELELPHVSCYGLTIEHDTYFGRLKEQGLLAEANDDLERRMYYETVMFLENHGLGQYEISNFSKPEYESRHNMNYWMRGDYLGFGAGAHSFMGSRRFAGTKDVTEYIESVRHGKIVLAEETYITREEALSESIILGLRLKKGIDLTALSAEYGIDLAQIYNEKFNILRSKELVEIDGSMIRLSEKGMDFANQVFMEFI